MTLSQMKMPLCTPNLSPMHVHISDWNKEAGKGYSVYGLASPYILVVTTL